MKRAWIMIVTSLAFVPVACSQKPALPSGAGASGGGGEAAKPIGPRVVEIKGPALEGVEGVTAARYEIQFRDPVLEELRDRDKKWQDDQDEETGKIKKGHKDKKEKERLEKKELKSSLPPDQIPGSPDAFKQVFHQPPQAQYYTGTCWSFGATSFMESEVKRISGKEVKLSEMGTVYYEYLAKASGFIKERGDSLFTEGSESNALTRIWKEHGAWPLEAYAGFTGEDERHDHIRLSRELQAVMDSLKANSLWDENAALVMLQVILDRHLGRPPETFEFEGKTYKPLEFVSDALKINPDDYVDFISTLDIPFYTQGEFKVPDNWWHDDSYYNVPLDEFYEALKSAIKSGYSLDVAVDVSEPGKDGENDVMFIPEYDIPGDHIDQLAREYRFAHEVTTDDHGVHLVGYAEHAGHDWFLVKDSGRSARRGKHKGYYFIRDDYVRLKMLSFTVHKDAVADLLAKFGK